MVPALGKNGCNINRYFCRNSKKFCVLAYMHFLFIYCTFLPSQLVAYMYQER